jgi:pimeloyl-ACP methyl ester carboxylesterase
VTSIQLPPLPLLDVEVLPVTEPVSSLLVALHGAGGDKHDLAALAAAMQRPGERVLLPSLRGHGASLRPAWGASPWDHVADLHRLIHDIHEPLTFMGYSYGGLVALGAAVALGRTRVSTVVVLDQSLATAQIKRRPAGVPAATPWEVEGAILKWGTDHRHLVECALSQGIRTVVVVAEQGVTLQADREFYTGLSHDQYRLVTVPWTHADLPDRHTELAEQIDPRRSREVTPFDRADVA